MKNSFEEYIAEYLKALPDNTITQAMAYALDGGKRFRPRIIFAIMDGFSLSQAKAYDAALALELIQTYSLIHDDLPAMDNDDMRRGKPSLHKAFREDIAILTGDQLLTDAFRVVAESNEYDPQIKCDIIDALSRYAGYDGMIYGQLLDVTNDAESIDKARLEEIQDNKTGGLFKIACLIPMYIAGIDRKAYYLELGSRIGQIFQNQDDLFDVIRSEEQMGKGLSDIDNDKGTALCVYSLEELKALIDEEFRQLDIFLQDADFDTNSLKILLTALKER